MTKTGKKRNKMRTLRILMKRPKGRKRLGKKDVSEKEDKELM